MTRLGATYNYAEGTRVVGLLCLLGLVVWSVILANGLEVSEFPMLLQIVVIWLAVYLFFATVAIILLVVVR